MLYRIYTEDLNRSKIENIVSSVFDGFSVVSSVGYWKRTKENSLIIEIVANKTDFKKIKDLATKIKLANKQESVLVQSLENNSVFI